MTESLNNTDDEPFFIGTPPSGTVSKPTAKGSVRELSAQIQKQPPNHQYFSLEDPEPLKGVRKQMANAWHSHTHR